MKAQLLQWWLARPPREQSILRYGALLLAGLLVLSLIILPVLTQHAALARSLPELRTQTANLEAQAEQAVALRAAGGATAPAQVFAGSGGAAAVEQSARASGLRTLMDVFSVQPDGRIQLSMSKVSFDAFLDWTRRLRRDAAYSVETLDSDALDEAGMVRLRATLRPSANTLASRP